MNDLSEGDFQAVCEAFGLGTLHSATPLGAPHTNTNARLVTSGGRYFLRHSTRRDPASLRFEAAVLAQLAEARFPCAVLHLTRDGQPFVEVARGRASLFGLISGEELLRSDLQRPHLLELGRELGRMHRLLQALPMERPNPHGREEVAAWLPQLLADRDPAITAAAAELQRAFPSPPAGLLPRGVIHGDLVADNVKWLEGRVAGIFDFELTGFDVLALDLAIAINGWCFDQGSYQWALAQALVEGYHSERPLETLELDSLLALLRFGAVRYCAMRLRDQVARGKAKKDPASYLARVRALERLGTVELKALLSDQ